MDKTELKRAIQWAWFESTEIRRGRLLRAMGNHGLTAPPQGDSSVWEHTEILADIVWNEIRKTAPKH